MDQVGSEGTAKGHPRVRPPQQEAWSDREDKGGAEQTASSADDRSFIALTPGSGGSGWRGAAARLNPGCKRRLTVGHKGDQCQGRAVD